MGMDFDRGRIVSKVKTKDREFYMFGAKLADSNWYNHSGGNVVTKTAQIFMNEKHLYSFLFAVYGDYLGGILADSRNKKVAPYLAFKRLNDALKGMETLDLSDKDLNNESLAEALSDYVNDKLGRADLPLGIKVETLEKMFEEPSSDVSEWQNKGAQDWTELTAFMESLREQGIDGLQAETLLRHAVLSGDKALYNQTIKFLYSNDLDALITEVYQTPQVANEEEYHNALGYSFMTEVGHEYLLDIAKNWGHNASRSNLTVSALLLDILSHLYITKETDLSYRQQIVKQFDVLLKAEADAILKEVGKVPEGSILTPQFVSEMIKKVFVEDVAYVDALSQTLASLGIDKSEDLSNRLYDFQVLKVRSPNKGYGIMAHRRIGSLSFFEDDMGTHVSAYQPISFKRNLTWLHSQKLDKNKAISLADYFIRFGGVLPEKKASLSQGVEEVVSRLNLHDIEKTRDAQKLIDFSIKSMKSGATIKLWEDTMTENKSVEQSESEPVEESQKRPKSQKKGIQKIVENFIQGIERFSSKKWEKPWKPVVLPAGVASSPHNGKTGNVYHGFNSMVAEWALMSQGYVDPRFYSFKQARELGGNVKKGAKSIVVSAPILTDIETTQHENAVKTGKDFKSASELANGTNGENQEGAVKDVEKKVKRAIGRVIGLRPIHVFHISDLENMPTEHQPVDDTVGVDFTQDGDREVFDKVVDRLKEMGLSVNLGGSNAFYIVGTKDIQIPFPERFKGENEENLIRTIFHETAHATKGVGVDREFMKELDKLAEKRGWDPKYTENISYAIEEGVAEMSANLIATRLGFRAEQENHASYMKSWIIDTVGSLYGSPSSENNNKPFDIYGEQEAFVLYKMIKDAGVAFDTIMTEDFVNEIGDIRRRQFLEITGANARSPEELKEIRKSVEKSVDGVEMDALLGALELTQSSATEVDSHNLSLSEASDHVEQALDEQSETPVNEKSSPDFW